MRNYVLFDECMYVLRATACNVGQAPRSLETEFRYFMLQKVNEDRDQICINNRLDGWIVFDRKQSAQSNRSK